jgi:hypothetical protein
MIDSFVFFLICLIGASVFKQSEERVRIAYIFAATIILHDIYFHAVSDNVEAYYISNGLLSMGVLWFIAYLKECPRLARDIQIVALVSILFDGIGYFTHSPDQEPLAYMTMYIFLYGWAIFTLNRGEPYGDNKVDTRLLAIRPNVHFRLISH